MMKTSFILIGLGLAIILPSGETLSANAKLDEWWKIVTTSYPRYNATTALLKDMEKTFPSLVKIYSIGKSVRGRELWVIKLREKVKKKRPLLVPPLKFVGNMHGDEVVGRVLNLILAVDLLIKYNGGDPRVKRLFQTTEIHLMPSGNPDGYEVSPEGNCYPDPDGVGRRNANKVDLNRNFPDQFRGFDVKDDEKIVQPKQPETLHIMSWIENNPFVLSLNFHGAVLAASIPFDSVPLEIENNPKYKGSGVASLAPDNAVFQQMAQIYVDNHSTMKHEVCEDWPENFKDGITNGAFWYNVQGGMQDYNYAHSNCFEITIELSCCKFPNASSLMSEWNRNKNALYGILEYVHTGVKGRVRDSEGKKIEGAEIIVQGIRHNVKTTKKGEYWRLLTAGTYKLGAKAQGYLPSNVVEVVVGKHSSGEVPIVDFTLQRDPSAGAKR